MGAPAEAGGQALRRVVVCDTGPLLHLAEANHFDLLQHAGELHIPLAVDAELTDQQAHRAPWIHVSLLSPPHSAAAQAWQKAGLLDAGEAEAIELARQLRADWLLTDDAAARLVAQSLGLEVHGSLGVVLWSAAVGRLPRAVAEDALDRLAHSSLWISPSVLAEAKAALNQLFRP